MKHIFPSIDRPSVHWLIQMATLLFAAALAWIVLAGIAI